MKDAAEANTPELGKTETSLATSALPSKPAPARWMRRADHRLERWSERFSPILVKETRQALKSRRFLMTFFALLTAGWLWSLFGVGIQGAEVFNGGGGRLLLGGYLVVLSIPLTLVIPFSVFHTLARDCQDGSYELISITRMSALHIILGKLASALVQMGVYFSAMLPFVAFTYLLRGVDLLTISLFLLLNAWISVSLTCIAILLATTATNPYLALGANVLTACGCVIAGLTWSFPAQLSLLEDNLPLDDPSFWGILCFSALVTVSLAAVLLLTAAAALDFPSQNRSTRVRWALLVAQASWAAWAIACWLFSGEQEFLYLSFIVAFGFWLTAGAVINSENPELSARAKRDLPHSDWGRMWLTWLNPGSGTGYVFVLLNYSSLFVAVLLAVLACRLSKPAVSNLDFPDNRLVVLGLLSLSYLAMYLGLGRLLILWGRRRWSVGPYASLVGHALLLLCGAILPMALHALILRGNRMVYDPVWQTPNWMWSLAEAVDRGRGSHVLLFAGALGLVLFVLNLTAAVQEVGQRRQSAPLRVQEDDRAQHPAPPPRPLDPWDEAPSP